MTDPTLLSPDEIQTAIDCGVTIQEIRASFEAAADLHVIARLISSLIDRSIDLSNTLLASILIALRDALQTAYEGGEGGEL